MLYREHGPAYPHHSFKISGCPEALTSTTIIKKYGVKLAQGGRNSHPKNPLRAFRMKAFSIRIKNRDVLFSKVISK